MISEKEEVEKPLKRRRRRWRVMEEVGGLMKTRSWRIHGLLVRPFQNPPADYLLFGFSSTGSAFLFIPVFLSGP